MKAVFYHLVDGEETKLGEVRIRGGKLEVDEAVDDVTQLSERQGVRVLGQPFTPADGNDFIRALEFLYHGSYLWATAEWDLDLRARS